MPHLAYEDKEKLLDHMYPTKAGELNFLITTMCRRYFNKSTRNYEAFNTIIGALESAKMEYYRLMVSKYEDTKIDQNGNVFSGDLK